MTDTRSPDRIADDDARDDYLWDRSGPVDPEIQRLEQTLGALRHAPAAPSVNMMILAHRRRSATLAAAALLAVSISGAWLAAMSLKPNVGRAATDATWSVVRTEGAPIVGSEPLTGSTALRPGQWIQTDGKSQARIDVASIGRVTVDPNSRVRAISAHAGEHRMQLERGRIDAFITAPPRLFFVDTPSATAIDLGCAYSLRVDDDGSGLLEVTFGWVALEGLGRESLVPRRALCRTRTGAGPGTPFVSDASTELRAALDQFDFADGGDAAAQRILEQATDHDAVTLWHLLSRVSPSLRGRVFDRLAEFVPPPAGVSRDGIMSLDRQMLSAWWDRVKWSTW